MKSNNRTDFIKMSNYGQWVRNEAYLPPSRPSLRFHDDVSKWKHFPRYWPFVRGIHRSPVISPHKGQWRGALMFTLICARVIGWVNNGEAGDLRRNRAHYDVIVMIWSIKSWTNTTRLLHIEAGAKWPPFRRRHFQAHFLMKILWFRLKFH